MMTVREALHTADEYTLKYLGMEQPGTFRKLSVIRYDKSVGMRNKARRCTDKGRQVLEHKGCSVNAREFGVYSGSGEPLENI